VTKRRRAAAWLLLVTALGLVLLGQLYFFHRREYLWDGLVFHWLAALCFVLAWRLRLPKKPPSRRRWLSPVGSWLRERSLPAILIGVGLFFTLIATLLSRDRLLNDATGDVVTLWLLGIGAVVGAAFWPTSRPRGLADDRKVGSGWRNRLREILLTHWPEAAAVTGLTILALIVRIAALDRVPYTLGGDEAWHGLLSRQVLRGEIRNPFYMGYMSMPTLFYWPLSWSLCLAGDNVTGLRLPAALVGTATVPILYLLTRRLWGQRIALLSAAYLAAYDYHVHYSRLGANNVWDPLFVVLVLWALDRGLTGGQGDKSAQRQRRGERAYLLAGLVLGLSFFFYTGARLLPLMVVAYVAFVWARHPKAMEGLGLKLVLLVLAFLVVAGPMLSYALTHPNEWNARVNQVGIIQSGWLEREPELTGKSTLWILAEQFLRAAGAFHVFPDRTVWYGADRPLLGFLPGAFAVLGMAWAVVNWRDRRYFLVLLWFWSAIITGGMLTESPPSSQRLVIAIPAVVWLVAIGVERTVVLARKLYEPRRKEWEEVALLLLILVLALGSVRYYFVEFTPSMRYGSENGETATMIGHYLRTLDVESTASMKPADYRVYFFGAPRIYWGFGTMSFLAPDVRGQDVTEPLNDPPDFVDERYSAVFLFLPERAEELDWVRKAFPEGRRLDFQDAGGRLRFIAYEVQR
jgi:4-amino-4-deoxy-L-arabinose transferase-like glycosyltransferase